MKLIILWIMKKKKLFGKCVLISEITLTYGNAGYSFIPYLNKN